MRPVDLYYYDPIECVDLSAISELMVAIELGEEDLPDFSIAEPALGPTIVHVASVVLRRSLAHAWILSQTRDRSIYYLGLGTRRMYLDCIYHGAPERVRADCLLSLNDAVPVLELLIDGKKPTPPLHWITQDKAIERCRRDG